MSLEKDINEALLLNGVRKSDGSVRDTSTEILKDRPKICEKKVLNVERYLLICYDKVKEQL